MEFSYYEVYNMSRVYGVDLLNGYMKWKMNDFGHIIMMEKISFKI